MMSAEKKQVSTDKEFVDHYEILESSCNASFETIERTFRFLAKRYHPDCSEEGDQAKFAEIVTAYETLRDPEKRAEYDAELESSKNEQATLVRDAGHATNDTADRHRILTLLYAQRRRNMASPGIGISTLESLAGVPMDVLEFHMWFFREKGWICREESGTLSISAAGVDKIEATVEKEKATSLMRITAAPDAITAAPDTIPVTS